MTSKFSRLLGPQGPLQSQLDGLESRPSQVGMAESVDAVLAQGGRLLVEAGTGTGKTFAYLLPALLRAREPEGRIVVSTWTRNLQEQIVNRDLPLLRRAFGIETRAALVQGRENYVCRRRATEALQRESVQFGDERLRKQHEAVSAWSERSREGRRGELPFVADSSVWTAVRAEQGKCLGQKSPFFGPCAWQWSRRRMREAAVLVVNHALLMADLQQRSRGAGLLPPFSALIVDEAHHLEEVAMSHLGMRLGRGRLLARLREVEASFSVIPSSVGALLGRTRDLVQEFYDQVERLLGGRPTRRFLERPAVNLEVTASLGALGGALDQVEPETEAARTERTADAEEMRRMALEIEQWAVGGVGEEVVWAEGAGAGVTLCSAPERPAEILETKLFDKLRTAVLTSATLRVPDPRGGDGFAYLRENTGCRDAEGLLLPSPFDFVRQARVLIDWLPEPSETAAWERALAERIPVHVRASEGRAFVLFTSRQTMMRVATKVAEALEVDGIEVLVQGRRLPRHVLLERFRCQQPAVLLGLASFWEGVDVPGEGLVQVILTRLPFPPPDHPLEEARCERLKRQGLDPFQERSLPQAVLRWKQGFGRLIRSRQDHGQVTVLDRRILSRRYGRIFLDALPECPRTVIRDGEEWPLDAD